MCVCVCVCVFKRERERERERERDENDTNSQMDETYECKKHKEQKFVVSGGGSTDLYA